MNINNPYAQAGWYNPQNPHSINQRPRRPNSLTATFSALPSSHYSYESVYTFTFTSFNPDIGNCVVLGPNNRISLTVRTDTSGTIISKVNQYDAVAVIRWEPHPTVEAASLLAPQLVGDFLKLSPDQRYRTMRADEKVYAWIPRQRGTSLYNAGPHPPRKFARMRSNNDVTKIYLELSAEAFPRGLLIPCILSTILFFSGRILG
ncbi:hypothetical protein GALMADRAFT_1353082 [Galerina marginata CBS 339.88]|uniref:Uncharacterized protein n=1 Tax=Galerina marginata (strain CBS 339.88) TaxID=685588 RepID=A0A067SDU5_GALM3|nr:hypothetical protein GALMADRAFT_1353082 [Galerina marginata CBS 339.88]